MLIVLDIIESNANGNWRRCPCRVTIILLCSAEAFLAYRASRTASVVLCGRWCLPNEGGGWTSTAALGRGCVIVVFMVVVMLLLLPL